MENRWTILLPLFFVLLFFAGCSHSIVINPLIAANVYGDKIPISVGLYIDKASVDTIYEDKCPFGETIRFSKGVIIRDYSLKTFSFLFSSIRLVDTKSADKSAGVAAVLALEILDLKGTEWSFYWAPVKAVATIRCSIYDSNGNIVWVGTGTGVGEWRIIAWHDERMSMAYEEAIKQSMEELVVKLRAARIETLLVR